MRLPRVRALAAGALLTLPGRRVDVVAHHNPGGFNADPVALDGFADPGSSGRNLWLVRPRGR